ncbi:MAG: DUF533 domain-containing protein [Hyphomicrobiales bacterium]
MVDAKKLLDVLLAGAGGGSPESRKQVEDAINQGSEAARGMAQQAATRVSDVLGQAQEKLKGTGAEQYVGQARDLVDKNPVAAVTALGGLAALLLGTRGGREMAGGLAKIGGLAAVGGIAYKALRNYQDGKALTAGIPGLDQLTAPAGSGYEPDAHTNDTATLMLKAMIACAAADGTVDEGERKVILGDMQQAGLGSDAAKFLADQIAHPASVDQLAAACGGSSALALQVYAAAHIVASSNLEKAFLGDLAKALKLDPALAAQVGKLVEESRGHQPV